MPSRRLPSAGPACARLDDYGAHRARSRESRPVFAGLRRLRDDLALRFPTLDRRHLSMGMTDDFEVAIEEGATMVRIGRAIFGESAMRDSDRAKRNE